MISFSFHFPPWNLHGYVKLINILIRKSSLHSSWSSRAEQAASYRSISLAAAAARGTRQVERADRAGTCRGTSKVPIEGLLRSQGPIRGTSSMLALLALPLLAMSARGQVVVMPTFSFLYKNSSGGGQEPAGGPHRGPGAAPVPGLSAVQVRTKKVLAQS